MHGHHGRKAHPLLHDPRHRVRRQDDRDRRGNRRSRIIPSSKPMSSTTACSAATARPASWSRRRRCSTRTPTRRKRRYGRPCRATCAGAAPIPSTPRRWLRRRKILQGGLSMNKDEMERIMAPEHPCTGGQIPLGGIQRHRKARIARKDGYEKASGYARLHGRCATPGHALAPNPHLSLSPRAHKSNGYDQGGSYCQACGPSSGTTIRSCRRRLT